jgi:hypothetical protein
LEEAIADGLAHGFGESHGAVGDADVADVIEGFGADDVKIGVKLHDAEDGGEDTGSGMNGGDGAAAIAHQDKAVKSELLLEACGEFGGKCGMAAFGDEAEEGDDEGLKRAGGVAEAGHIEAEDVITEGSEAIGELCAQVTGGGTGQEAGIEHEDADGLVGVVGVGGAMISADEEVAVNFNLKDFTHSAHSRGTQDLVKPGEVIFETRGEVGIERQRPFIGWGIEEAPLVGAGNEGFGGGVEVNETTGTPRVSGLIGAQIEAEIGGIFPELGRPAEAADFDVVTEFEFADEFFACVAFTAAGGVIDEQFLAEAVEEEFACGDRGGPEEEGIAGAGGKDFGGKEGAQFEAMKNEGACGGAAREPAGGEVEVFLPGGAGHVVEGAGAFAHATVIEVEDLEAMESEEACPADPGDIGGVTFGGEGSGEEDTGATGAGGRMEDVIELCAVVVEVAGGFEGRGMVIGGESGGIWLARGQ